MGDSTRCRYHSPLREQQAQRTRENILKAARTLLQTKGYAGMTVDALARMASVAPQTVYAVFGSKQGILRELMDQAVLKNIDLDVFNRALASDDPLEIVRCAVFMSRVVHESESGIYDLLWGARVVDPGLSSLKDERETFRHEKTRDLVRRLAEIGCLKGGLGEEAATDILWAFTSRDMYQRLVREKKWDVAAFESSLVRMLGCELVGPDSP